MSFKIFWDDNGELYDDDRTLDGCRLEKITGNDSGNVMIAGDNYPVLRMLKKSREIIDAESVDIIYIDPPYNTGNEFTYRDNFEKAGDKHSSWLSFMQRRLLLAQYFLCDSGCIFIAIDQSELYVLKILCDSIFGEENFVNDFMWLHGKGKKDTWSRTLQQHTLCYAKNKKYLKSFSDFEVTSWAKGNADNDQRGNWFSGSISFTEERSSPKHPNFYEIKSPSGKKWKRQWLVKKSEMEKLLAENKIYFGPGPEYEGVPRVKIFDGERSEVIPKNIIDCVESTRAAQKHLDEMLGEKGLFDNPKPVDLIEHLLFITQMKKDALIMDFFAGSGTTFEAVCKLNARDGGKRRCILVQKQEISQKNPEVTIDSLCRKRCEKVCELYNVEMDFLEFKV